jgi:glycosyltransferase involved in cell wall biosynthesis
MSQRAMALLGRRDEPTDAIEQYCQYLAEALRRCGIEMGIGRVPWPEQGWGAALRELREKADTWRGTWILLQYTALAWSTRGFPARFLRVMKALQDAGTRVGVVYHDVDLLPGKRVIDKMRRRAQLHTMRGALQRADLAVFTVPLENISWLAKAPANAVFIPVGANLPGVPYDSAKPSERGAVPTVSIFGVTGGEAGRVEVAEIVEALRFAAVRLGKLQLHAFGRNAGERESALRKGLRDVPVDVRADDLLPAEKVSEALCASDVLLFVRGPISTRRGSAIAGIACGLPVIAYGGSETAGPIIEAGVVLVHDKSGEVGEALVRVLANSDYRAELQERSRAAAKQYFAWDAIAARYSEALRK